jgi:16S rRNA processing protein RimM
MSSEIPHNGSRGASSGAPPDGGAEEFPGTPPHLVVIGRIGAAHGVGGALHVTSFTDPPDNIQRYRPWLLGRGDQFREAKVAGVRVHGQGYVARITGIDDRDQAQALAGTLIAVPRGALPALSEDEYYWRDLIGLRVVDGSGRDYGRVVRLIDTGAHDVLAIDGERETLIPFTAEFVLHVDLDGGCILVDWSEPV